MLCCLKICTYCGDFTGEEIPVKIVWLRWNTVHTDDHLDVSTLLPALHEASVSHKLIIQIDQQSTLFFFIS